MAFVSLSRLVPLSAQERIQPSPRRLLIERRQGVQQRLLAPPERERPEPPRPGRRHRRRRYVAVQVGGQGVSSPEGRRIGAERFDGKVRDFLRGGRRRRRRGRLPQAAQQLLAIQTAQPEEQKRVAVEFLPQQIVNRRNVLARVGPVRTRALRRQVALLLG